jgi:hypothetical protein
MPNPWPCRGNVSEEQGEPDPDSDEVAEQAHFIMAFNSQFESSHHN